MNKFNLSMEYFNHSIIRKRINLFHKLNFTFFNIFSSIKSFVKILFELTKFRITFFVAVTTAVGYILHSGTFGFKMLIPILGVLILASGASALNEYQERTFDSLMDRTLMRPIPSGSITAPSALLISLTLISIGSLLLTIDNLNVFLISLFTLFWYNFIYTFLKY